MAGKSYEQTSIDQFRPKICGQLHQAERREWWLANGLGGYAAGNIAGTLCRRLEKEKRQPQSTIITNKTLRR